MTRAPYATRLVAVTTARGRLCVGIDPHPAMLQRWELPVSVAGLETCARSMVETLGAEVAVFKPQSALFEEYGSAGISVLERTLADIAAAGALSILDVKRGDIGSTMAGYARAYLADGSPLVADAITVSPYLGYGSLAPAIDAAAAAGRGVYVLARTSNPEGDPVQLARTPGGRPVAQAIVDSARADNERVGGAVGLVVGATRTDTGIDLSGFTGSILAPGIGAQGGKITDLPAIFGTSLGNVLPTTSRGVMGVGPNPQRLREAARSHVISVS